MDKCWDTAKYRGKIGMFICDKNQFIFFHIPKTGGSTIGHLLGSYCQNTYHLSQDLYLFSKFKQGIQALDHMSYTKMLMHFPDILRGREHYTKWCFVRNPYTFFYSLYMQLIAHKQLCGPVYWPHLPKSISFQTFLSILDPYQPTLDYSHYNARVWNQIEFIYYNNKIVMDFVGRFENYEEDCKTILTRCNIPYDHIPHHNKRGDNDYLKFYTQEDIRIVNRHAERIFRDFNYEMLDPKDFPETVPEV